MRESCIVCEAIDARVQHTSHKSTHWLMHSWKVLSSTASHILLVNFWKDTRCSARKERIFGLLRIALPSLSSLSQIALQREPHLCIPSLGIARPQSQFSHSCVCERFMYSHDRSAYSAAGNMVRRGLDSSTSACCTAGPSSNLGSAPQRRPCTERKAMRTTRVVLYEKYMYIKYCMSAQLL